jgi:hypothetical protein
MGDLWNPFDKDNPVYVTVAKKTRQSRAKAQKQVVSVVVLAVLAVEIGRRRGLYNSVFNGHRAYKNYGINGMTAMRHRLNHRK